MFLIALKGKEKDGAYAITNKEGEKVLLFFQEEDDAERYKLLLEDNGYPQMEIREYDDDIVLKTVQIAGYNYSVVGPYDLVVPPECYDNF